MASRGGVGGSCLRPGSTGFFSDLAHGNVGRGTGTSSGVVVDCPRQGAGPSDQHLKPALRRPPSSRCTETPGKGVRKPRNRCTESIGTGVRKRPEPSLRAAIFSIAGNTAGRAGRSGTTNGSRRSPLGAVPTAAGRGPVPALPSTAWARTGRPIATGHGARFATRGHQRVRRIVAGPRGVRTLLDVSGPDVPSLLVCTLGWAERNLYAQRRPFWPTVTEFLRC
jgi:hypothetical protein